MEARLRILGILLVTGLLLLGTGCDKFKKAPTPTPTLVADIPAQVLAAREAALGYVRKTYAEQAPAEDIIWTGRSTTPPGLVGASYYEFTSGDWLVSIMVPVVAPSNVIYNVEVSNQDTGFRWSGKLDGSYGVIESNLDIAAEALAARDAALAYVREHYAEQAPAEGLALDG